MITKRQVFVARKSQATHYRSNAYHARLCTHAHVRTHVRTGLPIEASTAACRRQGTKRVILTNMTVQKNARERGFLLSFSRGEKTRRSKTLFCAHPYKLP